MHGLEATREMVSSAFYVWVASTALHNAGASVAVATAAGFAAAAVAYAYGAVTSPVLTAVMCAAGRTSPVQAGVNVVAQFSGAIVASALVALGSNPHGLGGNALPLGSGWRESLVGEIVATAMLTYAYMGAAPDAAPLVMGLGTVAAHIVTLPTSSCVLNPFRALAPAIVSGVWGKAFWTFVVGPAVGAAAGGALHCAASLGAAGEADERDGGLGEDMDAAMRRYRESVAPFS